MNGFFNDLRLAARLLRGSGRKDAARVVAMVLGVAFAVFAALISLAAPRTQQAAHDVLVARAPVMSDSSAVAGLRLTTLTATVEVTPWTQVEVTGAELNSPLPPGVSAWPRPGTSLVSPALRRVAATNRDVAATLGALAPGSIGSAGLTDPGELLSYTVGGGSSTASTVSTPGSRSDAAPFVTGYGNAAMVAPAASSGWLMVEIVVLVLTPAVLFLLTAMRLSLASRSQRTFALGLVGMSPRRTSTLYAREMGLIALAGYLIGAAVYEAVQGAIGRSKLLGVGWWPNQGELGWPLFIIAGALTLVLVRAIAKRAMRITATRSRSQRHDQMPTWMAVVAGGVLAAATGFLGTVVVKGLSRPSAVYASGPYSVSITVAVVVAVLALVTGAPALVAWIAEGVAGHLPVSVGLGLRGAAMRIFGGRRLISFVAAAVMLSGIGAAFVQALLIGAEGDPNHVQISMDVSSARQIPDWFVKLPGTPLIETTVQGRLVAVGDCTAVMADAANSYDHPGVCTDTVQRSDADGLYGKGGAGFDHLKLHGATIPVPRAPITADMPWDVKFPTAAAPWAAHISEGQITFPVSRTDGSYQRVLAQLHTRFPGVRVDAGIDDEDRYTVYQQQVGTVHASILLGIVLAVFSFLLAALEGRWNRTRSVAALTAIGASSRVLRTANAVEFVFPLLVAAVPAAVIALLGGWSILSFWGTDTMFSAQVPLWTMTGLAASLICGVMVGWLTGGGGFQREALSDT